MPHDVALITTIAAALGLALVLGFVAVRLRLPALVGYLVAGILIGPATPGFVADVDLSRQLAEIGVMLLMFGVGLHLSLDDLLAVKRIAVPGAVVQIAAATLLGLAVTRVWGWSLGAGLMFGLALSVASTVVLLRAIEGRGQLDTINGRIAVGWLVVEDIAMVLVLVVLPPLAGWLGGDASVAAHAAQTTGAQAAAAIADAAAGPSDGLGRTVALTLGRVTLFIALMLLVGRRVFPWVLWQVARTGSRELFTLCVIAAALGIAYGSAALFGVSFALGAFFAGMILRESALAHRAAEESLPLRDAFSVLFFVSVGMLFDPRMLVEQPGRILVVVGIIVLGKSIAAFLLVLAFRYPLNTALTVSAALAQIGEFSFILAGLGVSLDLLPSEGEDLILAGALISIALNPFVWSAIEPLQARIRGRSTLARTLERREDPLAELPMTIDEKLLTGHVVIVGYGRVGSRVGEALLRRGVPIVVAEQNREIVERLRVQGIPAVSGDASEPNVIVQAHVARARILVVTATDTFAARAIVDLARTINPHIETVLRTHSDEEAALLEREQAGRVFMGEHELARGMTRHVLERLGASGESSRGASPAAAAPTG